MSILFLQADAAKLPIKDGCVNCCVSSPPYWGLRDYGLKPSIWGGDRSCDHWWKSKQIERENRRGLGLKDSAASTRGGGHKIATVGWQRFEHAYCSKCNAWRGVLGLEPTPGLYVAHMVEVFREVRRVLREDGVLWLNLGDSYANDTKWGGKTGGKHVSALHGEPIGRGRRYTGLKPKDLVGIPWRVAFALQADGWYLRSDIIWAKPNPMPESVTDRPTKAHEYIFLLAKSERYFWDNAAVAEPFSTDPRENYPARAKITGRGEQGAAAARGNDRDKSGGFPPRSHKGSTLTGVNGQGWVSETERHDSPSGRNIRTVWTIATQPYADAHYATFPEALVRPCILAGCPEGGTVLDPFGGSGTVARVAAALNRNAVHVDLKYHDQSKKRTTNVQHELLMPEAQA